ILDGTLAARPAVYVVWIVLSILSVPMFIMASKELAPSEDQGIVFGIVDAAADATIDQTTFYAAEVNQQMMSTPEAGQSFQLIQPNSGFSGMVLKPWGE